jgi:hypothetical protein
MSSKRIDESFLQEDQDEETDCLLHTDVTKEFVSLEESTNYNKEKLGNQGKQDEETVSLNLMKLIKQ